MAALLPAQSYNPFPGAHTYNFVFKQPSDTFLHSVRVDTIYASGADSAFAFRSTLRLNATLDFLGGCNPNISVPAYDYESSSRYPFQPSAFGHLMLKCPNGRFEFHDTLGLDTFLIETQLGVGASWTVNQPRSLTATLDSITWESIFGSMDSVMHISLCNGRSIGLSKHHGFTEAVPWLPIHHKGVPASAYPPQYELRGIDETGLGTPRDGFYELFSFDPNDRFQVRKTRTAGIWNSLDQYTERIIQNWGPTATGLGGLVSLESLSYTNSFNILDTIYSAPSLQLDSVQSAFYFHLHESLESADPQPDNPNGIKTVLECSRLIGGRTQYEYRIFDCNTIFCSVGLTGSFRDWKIRENLGEIYRHAEDPYGQDTETSITELICYETSWGMGGICVNLLALATGVNDEEAFSVGVLQDKNGGKIHLLLPEGDLHLKLFGSDGKMVWEMKGNAAQGRVDVDVSAIAAGIYVLEVSGASTKPFRKKVLLFR